MIGRELWVRSLGALFEADVLDTLLGETIQRVPELGFHMCLASACGLWAVGCEKLVERFRLGAEAPAHQEEVVQERAFPRDVPMGRQFSGTHESNVKAVLRV